MADDKMLGKVRALLTKAEAEGVTPEEAEALTAKAAELMARYGIDAAMAAARADQKIKATSVLVAVQAPYANGKDALLNTIVVNFGCQGVVTRRFGEVPGGGKHVQVFGFEADLEMVQMLYTSLLLQGASASVKVPSWENTRSYRVSFWAGFGRKVNERLVAAKRKAQADTDDAGTPGTALVLRSRDLAVKEAVSSEYSRVTKGKRSQVRVNGGYHAGIKAGEHANLHQGTAVGRRSAGQIEGR